MKKILLSIFAILLVASPHIASANTINASGLFDLVNAERTKAGLQPLAYNALLQKAAQEKVNDMVEKGYFAHTSPDGKEFQAWMDEAGYKYGYAGENIVFTTGDSNEVMLESWMSSASHRASILSSNFTESGLAIAAGTYKGEPAVYAVQMFASPRLQNQTGIKSEIAPSAPSINTVTGTPTPKIEPQESIQQIQSPNSQTIVTPAKSSALPPVTPVKKSDPVKAVKIVEAVEDEETASTTASVTIGSETVENAVLPPTIKEESSWISRFVSYISRWVVNIAQAFA